MLGVTVTLTATSFDCPLPPINMPCTDGLLGNSPMACTWIKSTEVRLVGIPMEATMGDPITNSSFRLSVTIPPHCPAPIKCVAATDYGSQVSFKIDNLVYSYGALGFSSVNKPAFETTCNCR
jgi:hypothetical protein